MGQFVFDERDKTIRDDRVAKFVARTGPRVGDWVIMPDGTEQRFTHAWPDGLQTTCAPRFGLGSFYFDRQGFMDYSGALDPVVKFDKIRDTGKIKDGAVWFFHHDQSGAGRGVNAWVPCRVYEVRS